MSDDDIDDESMDLDDDMDGGFDGDFEDFDSGEKKTLGDLWRESPMVKIGAIVLGLLFIVFIFSLFGGKKEEPVQSMVSSGSQISAAPGTEEASPAYVDAVIEENETRVEDAMREGGSALPTPIEPPIGRLTIPEEEKVKEDPLQRWRRIQEERLERELTQAKTVTQTNLDEPNGASGTEALQAISENMSAQMQAILERQNKQVTLNSISVTPPSYLESLAQAAEEAEIAQNGNDTSNDTNNDTDTPQIRLVAAADIEYAQTLIEANSDVPGPVLAQIVSGPLAGARALGDFSVQDDLLTLNFSSAVLNGEVISINAIALDPATTLPAMATDVNHRYFRRIVLPAAASFVEGMADAIEQSGRTTVIVDGSTVTNATDEANDEQEVAAGVSEAGQKIGEIIDELGDVEPLIRIRTGTPMALLFLQEVLVAAPPEMAVNTERFR